MKSIIRLSYIAVPVIIILGCFIIYYAMVDVRTTCRQEFGNESHISLLYGTQLVVGSYISGSIISPNFTKDAQNPSTAALISFLAFSLGNGIMFLFGALSYVLVGGSDIFDMFVLFGLLPLGIIVLGLNIWSSCDNGLYSAGIEIERILGVEYKKTTLIIGFISILFSRLLYYHFQQFLILLNKIIPPIGVVLIANFLMNTLDGSYIKSTRIQCINFIAVVLGAVVNSIDVGFPLLNSIMVSSIICVLGKLIVCVTK